MMELLVFFATFGQVFFLGLNSKILRDDHILAGAGVSWFITIAVYFQMWTVVHSNLSPMAYLFLAGLGGSTGITASQYFYKWIKR